MATLYQVVYSKFINRITDINLAMKFATTIDLAENETYDYLDSACAEFTKCKQDLNNRIEPQSNNDVFSGDGATTNFLLSTIPNIGSSFIITINDIIVYDYIYNENTNEVIFSFAPLAGVNNINITWRFSGQFNITLIPLEKEIIIKYMIVAWMEKYISSILNLQDSLGSNDFKIVATASNLRPKMEYQANVKKAIDDDITNYGYDLNKDYSSLC